MSYIVVAVIRRTEADMHITTHTLGLNPAADCCLARVRETMAGFAGAPAIVTRDESRFKPERATGEDARPHLRSNRIHPGLRDPVENALFAVTLVAIGCQSLGALLTHAL